LKGKLRLLLILGLIVMLAVSGCGGGGDGGQADAPPADQNETSQEVQETKTINIGFTGPLSGGAALYGKDVTDGLELAVEEINAQGIMVNGEKYVINLVKLDDQYMPDKAATNARRLRDEYKTPVVFVPHSGGVYAIQQFNEAENLLLLAYTSEPGVLETGNTLTMRIPPRYTLYLEEFANRSMERFGNKLGVIPSNTQYGKDWTEAFLPVWESKGGVVVAESPIDYNKESDFYTYVSQVLAAGPDVLFVGGPSQPTALVIDQARQLGFEGGFVVMDQAKIDQMAQIIPMEKLEGAIGSVPLHLYNSPGTQPFIERYKARYDGKAPTWESTYNYQTMWLVAKGIEKAGNVDDAKAIFRGMKDSCPFEDPSISVVNVPAISDKGDSLQNATAAMVIDGQFSEPINIQNPENPYQ
jgi:branched-chain amino acid transport system substrate-binding protein